MLLREYVIIQVTLFVSFQTPLISTDFAVRLVDGPNPYTGRVEVYHSDQWGTICDHGFGFLDADVICHELGYPGVDSFLPYGMIFCTFYIQSFISF